MNFAEIKKLVIAEYDSRDLATDIRPKALDSFEDYLKLKHLSCWNDVSKLPDNKGVTKRAYAHFKGAATSVP